MNKVASAIAIALPLKVIAARQSYAALADRLLQQLRSLDLRANRKRTDHCDRCGAPTSVGRCSPCWEAEQW